MIKFIEVREFKNDGYEYYHETFEEALESIKSNYESLTESEKRDLQDYLIIDCKENFGKTFENEEELKEFESDYDYSENDFFETDYIYEKEYLERI